MEPIVMKCEALLRLRRVYRLPVFVAALPFLMCVSGSAEPNREGRSATVLFDQFETIFYSKLPLSDYKLAEKDIDALNFPFSILWHGLEELDQRAATEVRSSSLAVLVGTKDYRGPEGGTGLGAVRFRFCYIVVLKRERSLSLAELFRGHEGESMNGLAVWKWSVALSGESPEITTLFATQIQQDYLVISENPPDLQSVSQGLKGTAGVRGTAKPFREWQTVSQHDFWGYRRYDRQGTRPSRRIR